MSFDAESLDPDGALQADVCVVGAGPAGLTLCHRLAQAGLRVLVIEAGSGPPPRTGHDVTSTTNVGLPYRIGLSRAQGVGGSSLRWDIETPVGEAFVRLRELDPFDFETRPGLDRSGWPFSKEALARHYRDAWALFGLREQGEDHDVGGGVRRRPFSFGPASTFYERLTGAARQHSGVTLVAGTSVTEIRTADDPGVVSSVVCRGADGSTFDVRARAFVLAGGGIENPRLLLASTSTHPSGLGNSHDQVGRYFMEHPHYLAGVLVARLAEGEAGWGIVARDGQAYESKYGLDSDVIRREGLLSSVCRLLLRASRTPVPLRRDGRVDHAASRCLAELSSAAAERRRPAFDAAGLGRLVATAPSIAGYVARQQRGRWADRRGRVATAPRVYTVSVMAEQEPRPESRVRLRAELDAFGVPKAELDWRVGPLDAISIARTTELVGAALARSFGGRFTSMLPEEGLPQLEEGWHHMGTTRMSTSPSSGVVDPSCRVHGVANLYVAGSSVFPTSGYANPTLTIVALAARLGEHLVKELGARPSVTSPEPPVGRRGAGPSDARR